MLHTRSIRVTHRHTDVRQLFTASSRLATLPILHCFMPEGAERCSLDSHDLDAHRDTVLNSFSRSCRFRSVFIEDLTDGNTDEHRPAPFCTLMFVDLRGGNSGVS